MTERQNRTAAATAIDERGLLSHEWAAAYLDTAPATLHQWNSKGIGPKSYRLGKHRKYRLEDLDTFIESRASSPRDVA